MPSLIKKTKKGHTYYYAVQSARVNGKPRIVWQKYLGTLDAIIRRADQTRPPAPKEVVVFELGGVAALLRIAQRLRLIDLINDVVPKRHQGPTVGHYLVAAALNRALAPCSKRAFGEWYVDTILSRLWRFPQRAFSSQRFWDHMDLVTEEAITQIQECVVEQVKAEFGLEPGVLLYDTTNFFTFVATANDRVTLAQRGNNKAKRYDLRQVNLALVVTGSYHVPLLHRVYPGNIPDVSFFREIAPELIAWHARLAGEGASPTLVFDKGNVSDDEMAHLAEAGVSFVAALSANRCPELLSIKQEEMRDVPGFAGVRAWRTPMTLWGKECQVVVTYTESFFTQQLAGVTQHLVQCQGKLQELQRGLEVWHRGSGQGRRPTVSGVQKRINEILAPQFMGELFETEVQRIGGLPRLRYRVHHDALTTLTEQRLGRTLLVTDHLAWNEQHVIETYRSLTHIEDVFKDMKNVAFLRWQPAFHWTDQKVMVHGFYCVLALLLATLARQVVVEAGMKTTVPALLRELNRIREVAVIYPPGTLAHRTDHLALTRMTPRQRKMAELLGIAQINSEG